MQAKKYYSLKTWESPGEGNLIDDPDSRVHGLRYYDSITGAQWAAHKFGGKLYGYHIEQNNPRLRGNEEGGIDFCLVQDRYIVDPWGADIYGGPVVLDLQDPNDAEMVSKIYEPRSKWEPVPLAPGK
jgi:hypothetical protein